MYGDERRRVSLRMESSSVSECYSVSESSNRTTLEGIHQIKQKNCWTITSFDLFHNECDLKLAKVIHENEWAVVEAETAKETEERQRKEEERKRQVEEQCRLENKVTFHDIQDSERENSVMYLTGSLESLGWWDVKCVHKMNRTQNGVWVHLDYIPETTEFLYSYLLLQEQKLLLLVPEL